MLAPRAMVTVARKRQRAAAGIVEPEVGGAAAPDDQCGSIGRISPHHSSAAPSATPDDSPSRRGRGQEDNYIASNGNLMDRWDALVEREQSDAYAVTRLKTPTDSWRRGHLDFAIDICDQYDIDRWIVGAAFALFDRYFARGHVRSGEWSLALVACLHLAIKLNGSLEGKTLDLEEVLYVCQGMFDAEDIVEMEQDICRDMEWRLNPPIPEAFLCTIEPLLMEDEGIAEIVPREMRTELVEQSKLLCELSVLDRNYVGVKPSSIAYAAVLVAMDLMAFPVRVIQWFENLSLEHDAEETSVYAAHLHVLCEREDHRPRIVFVYDTNDEPTDGKTDENVCSNTKESPADVKVIPQPESEIPSKRVRVQ